MEKIKLSQLTEKDAENLMDNSKVWEKTTGEIAEDVSLVLDDFIDALKGLSGYSISDSSDRENCLSVENSYDFLASLEDACGYNAGVLSDKQLSKADELVGKYDDTDSEDEQQEQLEDDMDNLASDYANILLKNMVATYDTIYNKDYVKDFMLDNLENIYPEGAYYNREDNKIYYITQD